MKIGFLGDIVGKPGREIVRDTLPKARQDLGLDLVIANAENAAHGFGFNQKVLEELMDCGIDIFTGGNHSFDNKAFWNLYDTFPIIRPANYAKSLPGKGMTTFKDLAIINLLGNFAMPICENAFNVAQDLVEKLLKQGKRKIFIDFHAETTSEKMALMRMLEGKISFIAGTHTHTGTDDLIIKDGTGFITDVGLNGCFDGVIGMAKKEPIEGFKTGVKFRLQIPKKCTKIFQLLVFELSKDGKCMSAQKHRKIGENPLEKINKAVFL